METKVTRRWTKYFVSVIAVLFIVALSGGVLHGCSSGTGGEGSSSGSNTSSVSSETNVTKTLVKTASNDLVLANLGDKAQNGILTISSGDSTYADFISGLENHTGFTIEDLTIEVKVTSSTGAVLGAGGETASQLIYTIESLTGKTNSEDVSYTKAEGFK